MITLDGVCVVDGCEGKATEPWPLLEIARGDKEQNAKSITISLGMCKYHSDFAHSCFDLGTYLKRVVDQPNEGQ